MDKTQKQNFKKKFSSNKDRVVDASHQDNFMFNKTPILASALKKLKTKSSGSSISKAPKRSDPIDLQEPKIQKKVKKNLQDFMPTLSYTPLQRDLYNFFTINKAALKNFQAVPQPKFQSGSTILTALCDRGIGGKFLVANLFRNKKCYIDYKQISLNTTNEKKSLQILQKYEQPGQYIVGTVVKGRNQHNVQLSLSKFLTIDEKNLKIGQVFPAQIKSKQELGCHLTVYGISKHKVFLPKSNVSQDKYEELVQEKQILVVIKDLEEGKKIIKVSLAEQEQLAMNFKGLEEEELSKLDLDQYVTPGTLLNTKILKILKNGLIVKFLKVFVGFIHFDHLNKELQSYAVGEKLQARVIFYCINPPMLYLSQKHTDLSTYEPKHELYSQVNKPTLLQQKQGAFFNKTEEIFLHPSQIHTHLNSVPKLWVKQNNYFQKYQIMTCKKIGLVIGEVAKMIPFSNFKVYGEKQNKEGHRFRVMCLDVWNKVVKISYDEKIVKAKRQQLLFDTDSIRQQQTYLGFIMGINPNGVVVQFCNNIRGIITKNQLTLAQIQLNEQHIGQSLEVYVSRVKKGYLGLSLKSPEMRGAAKSNKEMSKNKHDETSQSVENGTIQSINTQSIYPIYIKLKNRIAKISVFQGIKAPSVQEAHVVANLEEQFSVGQTVRVFRKGKQYFLYPPEQMKDKDLRFCRILGVKGSHLRVQTGDKQFKNCHITNITDIITPHPLSEYKVGQYTIGRVINQQQICLRKSIVQGGIPKNMQQCIKRYSEQEKNGDLRNRILTIGSSALKTDMICFGYVKNTNDKGCFVSLTHDYEVRVDRSQLSDQLVKEKEKQFHLNKLVLVRLIGSRVKNNQPNKVMFDASLRESVVKFGYPLNDQILEHGVGLTVKGTIKGYTKGKALAQLNSSKFTGIIAFKDIENSQNQTIQKCLPIGSSHKFKIIQYQFDGEKRLIRLSLLDKYFKKYQGFQTTFEADQRILLLWQRFRALEMIEPPVVEKQINIEEDNLNEEDQERRIMQMLAGEDVEANQQEDNLQYQNQQQDVAMEQQQIQEGQEMLQNEDSQQIDQDIGENQEQEIEAEELQKQKKIQHEDFRKRTAMFEKMPHDPSFYHSLVLANPTPESWLMYISSLLNTSSADQIRNQFLKAIHSFSQVKDKDNMWISWINMELILGDFQGTVKKAVQNNVGMNVYFRVLQILTERQQWDIAIEFGRKMLKKFNREMKAYIQFLKMVSQYGFNNIINEAISPKQILRRASQCLKTHQVITIESHMAKYMFEHNEAEKGRNVFEDLISKHPKRTDLWSMYVDMEIKAQEIDKARNILERVLSLTLNKKQTKAILKKYYTLEQQHGSEKSAKAILQRAQKLAENFDTNNQEPESMDEEL